MSNLTHHLPHLPHYKNMPLESLYEFCILFYNDNDLEHAASNLKTTPRRLRASILALEESIDVQLIERDPLTDRIDWSQPIRYTRPGQLLLARTAPFMCGLFDLEHKIRVSQHVSQFVTLAKSH